MMNSPAFGSDPAQLLMGGPDGDNPANLLL